jgi:colanic acid biosynthesis glycosyl transferase WcaI
MLASSRPLVATAHPDCELGRIAAQFGRIVPPGDDAAFADAIAALAADPTLRAALGAAGRIWAEHHLDRDAILHELESAMQALLPQATGAGAPAGVTE